MTDYFVAAGNGAPAVVVAHDWYGLLPHVRALCDGLAQAGLSALAVDFYDGRSTTDEAEAEQLMGELDGAHAKSRLTEAVRNLRRADVMAPRISGIGFGMGAQLVLDTATAGLFDAVVAYDASSTPVQSALPCPVLVHRDGLADVDAEAADAAWASTLAFLGGHSRATHLDISGHRRAGGLPEL